MLGYHWGYHLRQDTTPQISPKYWATHRATKDAKTGSLT